MAQQTSVKDALANIQLDKDSFLALMKKIIGCSKLVQNNPPSLIPQEDLVASIVVEELAPFTQPNGPLEVRKLTYTANRSNVMIVYRGTTNKVVSFVGSHMDVVPANPEEWERDPFSLTIDGDKLYGRGVTDCLGHVALLTEFFKSLAQARPKLDTTVVAVFIANEEASDELGIGIDEMQKRGELDFLKAGPLLWVDSANFGPTLGTGGMLTWELTARGKKFHSGLYHRAVNAIELANEAVRYLQNRFYQDFTTYAAEEKKYLFMVGSSMKPTRTTTPPGSLNQIPGECSISGDIRFTPFYSGAEVKAKIEQYVKELKLSDLPTFGESRFEIEDTKGSVELKWLSNPYQGVAVDMNSPGYKALYNAIDKATGKAEPYSLTGSLPIIRDLKDSGFDVQMTGFGRLDAYHANNEFGYLSDFVKGMRVVAEFVAAFEQ